MTINEGNDFALRTNLTIWVVYASEKFLTHIRHQLDRCKNINIETVPLSSFNVEGISSLPGPDLVFIETGVNWAKRIVELQNQASSLQEHEASLIVFGDEADTGALKISLRIGASDFLSDKAELEEVMPMLKATADEKIVNRALGELYLFVNTKGGAGATTLALNTAIELKQIPDKKVLLVDLDVQFGVVAEYLDTKCKYDIADVLDSISDLDEISLASLVTKHSSGLEILGFRDSGAKENAQTARNMGKLMPILRQFYDYVVVDLSRGVEYVYSSIVAPASRVFLVTQQNLISVKNANNLVRTLQFEYALPKDSLCIILNRFEKRGSVRLKDLEKVVSGIEIHLVPNEYKVAVECADLGKPIVLHRKSSVISKSLKAITQELTPSGPVEKGWLGKLFS
ncbi:AAA family ATPase [Vibrio sp. JC009]|uniref:AAA family ATPase n=1 Tax=Vibrio sp. JC009 TaxID=2912314 RepID=UPI0023B0AAD4|nr:AAA family ATPase [Vibrio sp. JC009]WED21274.1 AAA family ATPase [Vibrio sp. JC009]